jgi:DNA mismatch repair protein MSH3
MRIRACERELEDLLPGLRKLLRNPSLQYKSVLGTDYLVEAPPAQRVPADWIKVNELGSGVWVKFVGLVAAA